ncbi:MAG: hypothetical protein JO252_23640 [Planctomycetaceae bacterium]|nr:hypothetical protein [Planctomycetaceae bacterium]
MPEAIVVKVLFRLEGDGTTIRYSDRGVSDLPGPPQLAYHGPLAEDQTISGDNVQQAKTVAGTLITVPLRTIDVATTLTVLLPDITFAKPVGQGWVAPPVDFQTVAITTTRVIPTQLLNIKALSLKGTASQVPL